MKQKDFLCGFAISDPYSPKSGEVGVVDSNCTFDPGGGGGASSNADGELDALDALDALDEDETGEICFAFHFRRAVCLVVLPVSPVAPVSPVVG